MEREPEFRTARSGRLCAACRRAGLSAALLLLLLLLLAGCGGDSNSGGGTGADAEPLPALRRLHATRGPMPAIRDDQGRQVLLRGLNYNSLGDYYQADPAFPPTVPVMPDDLPRMASLGLNVIRLVLSWSLLEPEKGVFSESYLNRIADFVDQAAENGMYVVLDMHQDAWGKFIATPPEEVCRPPLEPAIGWDGAPQWATLTDGRPTCRLLERELSAAVAQAFQSFYADREGIQTEFVNGWRRLAERFADVPAVAGYDLLNEPNPGFTVGWTDTVLLGLLYNRLIEAIREAEQVLPGGFSHIVFFEPDALWSAFGTWPVPQPGFTDDSNIVFAPHIYADSHVSLRTDLSIEEGFALAQAAAERFGTAFWSGEWNFGELTREGDPERVAEYGRTEDAYLVGGAFWQWRFACGDPHMIEKFGAPPPETIRLIRNGCPGDVDLGFVEPYARVLSRSYPRSAPGRLRSLVSDPASGVFELAGETEEAGTLDCWIPDRGNGAPEVYGVNLTGPVLREVPGGFRLLVTVSSAYEVGARFPR